MYTTALVIIAFALLTYYQGFIGDLRNTWLFESRDVTLKIEEFRYILNVNYGTTELRRKEHPPTLKEIGDLVSSSLDTNIKLKRLKGFDVDFSANKDFHKVFFSASCSCGTAAVLSVEVSNNKTMDEIKQALPSLSTKLTSQSEMFYRMSCDMHKKMRSGLTDNFNQQDL